MDVVLSIVQGDEIQAVKIFRVGKAAKKLRPTTESFQGMVDGAIARVKEAEANKRRKEEETIAKNWPNAIEVEIIDLTRNSGK